MRNFLIIIMIVVAMGYMVSLLFDKYERVSEQQKQDRVIAEQKAKDK